MQIREQDRAPGESPRHVPVCFIGLYQSKVCSYRSTLQVCLPDAYSSGFKVDLASQRKEDRAAVGAGVNNLNSFY